jgi:hypothetical protein
LNNSRNQLVIDGINYAAYRETDSSLHDSDKNRLFGSEHYTSGRPVYKPSPWAEGDFEEKMATLLVWASVLNCSVPAFADATLLLEAVESVIGRVIRLAKHRQEPEQFLPVHHISGNRVLSGPNQGKASSSLVIVD